MITDTVSISKDASSHEAYTFLQSARRVNSFVEHFLIETLFLAQRHTWRIIFTVLQAVGLPGTWQTMHLEKLLWIQPQLLSRLHWSVVKLHLKSHTGVSCLLTQDSTSSITGGLLSGPHCFPWMHTFDRKCNLTSEVLFTCLRCIFIGFSAADDNSSRA